MNFVLKPFLTICVCFALGCGGGGESPEEAGGEESSGGESTGAQGKSVEEMTTGDELKEVVEETCEDGSAACEGAGSEDFEPSDATEGDEEEGDGTDGGEAAEPEDNDVDPKVAWRRRVSRGKQVFIKRCDFCHPDGDEDTGPKLKGISWPVPKTVNMIRKGKGKMKPMGPSKISSRQMRDLLAYLSTIRAVRGVERP